MHRSAAMRSLTVVYAKKRHDGKLKRPKVDGGHPGVSNKPPPPATTQSASTQAPPRVSGDINIPVRTQIRLVKQVKKLQQQQTHPGKAPVTKTYRRESKTPEEYRQHRAEEQEELEKLSKVQSKNIVLSSLYKTYNHRTGTSSPRKPPVLLVDGYNVLFKWEKTAGLIASGELEQARDVLIEALGTYCVANGVLVVIAFDAMNGSSALKVNSEYITSMGVTVVYCAEYEADTFIEGQVSVYLERKYPQVIVATSDEAQKAVVDSRRTVDGRQFCWVIPSSGLIKDIEATQRRVDTKIKELNNRPIFGGLLGSVVKNKNGEAFEVMQSMRMNIPGGTNKDGPTRGR